MLICVGLLTAQQSAAGPTTNAGHQLLLTRWLVFRLSTCFLNTACQKSLHRNLIMSNVSPSRGLSLLYLQQAQHITSHEASPLARPPTHAQRSAVLVSPYCFGISSRNQGFAATMQLTIQSVLGEGRAAQLHAVATCPLSCGISCHILLTIQLRVLHTGSARMEPWVEQ